MAGFIICGRQKYFTVTDGLCAEKIADPPGLLVDGELAPEGIHRAVDLLLATVEITAVWPVQRAMCTISGVLKRWEVTAGGTHPDAAGDEGLLRVQRRKMLYGILDDHAKLLFAKKMLHITDDMI